MPFRGVRYVLSGGTNMGRLKVVFVLIMMCLSACEGPKTDAPSAVDKKKAGGAKMADIRVSSPAFENEAMIPAKYTCDGRDISPPLSWEGLPQGAKSIALISDDPDAPVCTWVHWVIWNIPADKTGLPESMPKDRELPDKTRQGTTDFKRIGYGGPCPPGGVHRYYFKLYALDAMLELEAGATKAQLLKAMEGHILAKGELMGKYTRER